MQACDFSSHLDRIHSAGGHHYNSTKDTAITNFGNIMIQEALKISYLDIFSGFHCYKALLVFVLVLTLSVKYVGS